MKLSESTISERLVLFLQFFYQFFLLLVSVEQAFDDLGHLLLVQLKLFHDRVVNSFLHFVDLVLYLFVAGLQSGHSLLDLLHLSSDGLHFAWLNGLFEFFGAVPIEIAIG